jgi:ribosomal protein S18 acetylase RimI-like enzyme
MNSEKITLDDITIRTTLQSGDIGYVIYLHGLLYKKEYGYELKFEAYVAQGIYEFYSQYDPEKERVWVCEHHGKMIGFMLLMNRGKAAQLRYFLFEPAYRGIGLGKKLMSLYMEFLKECKYESSYLLTTDELPAAASLYIRHGFKLIESKKSDAFGKPVNEQRYEMNLIY